MNFNRKRKNRSVKPYRGELYKMVITNFAHVPYKDSHGRLVKDESGTVKKIRRKEVSDTFEIYYDLCLVDEYFKSLYESNKKGKVVISNIQSDFGKSWKYLLRKYASKAPKGMSQLAKKIETRLKDLDQNINKSLIGIQQGLDLNDVMVGLKIAAGSQEYRKTIQYYSEYLKQAFAMLGMNVVSEVKSNPKFNIKYYSFSEGNNMSELISKSSAMLASQLEEVQKLKELRDAKLKQSLLKEGYIVESAPVFVKDKGMVYLTVAYDPVVSMFPKPNNKPTKPSFNQKQYDFIVNLESLVASDTIYPGSIDPREFFKEPKTKTIYDANGKPNLVYKDGEEEKNNRIIEEIKGCRTRSDDFAVPQYKEGYGLLPNGEPEAGYYTKGLPSLIGKPIHRYTVSKSKLKGYNQASKIFTKLLSLRGYHLSEFAHSESIYQYKEDVKPFIEGVYNSDFTDDKGTSFEKFDDMETLAKKVLEKKNKKKTLSKMTPKISTQSIVVENYPVFDSTKNKIVYKKKKIKVAKFSYDDASYNPVLHMGSLNDVRSKIALGEVTPTFREVKDGDGSTGISKTLQVATVMSDSEEEIEIVVSGRYAGLELADIINMEGRFLEEGYYTRTSNGQIIKNRIEIDSSGDVSTVIPKKVGDKWVYDQRLIEPYITYNKKKNKLVLGIPGGRSNTADRRLMKSLAGKISSIQVKKDRKLQKINDSISNLNPFYTFNAEDFEVIRDTLGSVAMSESASKYMDQYYDTLRAKESANTEENLERFTPEAIGGFVKSTAKGDFSFNNKQKEAVAWLEASGMQGVVALDTGVGKTLTSLVAIKKAINEEMEQGGGKRRFLFVSPSSLVGNLKQKVLGFMSEGGDKFIRADGKEEVTPNWKKIVLSRITEMSYEDFVLSFEKEMGTDKKVEVEASDLNAEIKDVRRMLKYQGKSAVISYELCFDHDTNKEVWKKEIDFKIGTLDPSMGVRTSSVKTGKEVKTVYEQVEYPNLSASEEVKVKKERTKIGSEIRKVRKEIQAKSFPKVNKKFEKKYYACFFDEINEIFEKGKKGKDKRLAVASLSHPRKVFLTASAIDRDPVDLYRLSTLAKGQVPSPKSVKSFAEKYGVVLAGRMVALKPNKEVREQFHNWVKENAYFAPKTDISYDDMGVNYSEVSLPVLQKVSTTTISTRMPKEVQKKYKEEAEKIKGNLQSMLIKYRNLKSQLEYLSESGDLVFNEGGKSKAYQDLTKATGVIASSLKKLSRISAGDFKVPVATNLFKEDTSSRVLYFSTNEKLALKIAKKNSKTKPDGVHAVCWATYIEFFQNGKSLVKIKSTDAMGLKDFDALLESKNISMWSDVKNRQANAEEDDGSEATWAMDISKKYIKDNGTLHTAICSDNYARGFNFQTFSKVVHLDRGNGFDSELLKQRTARAYRGGQKVQVQEFYIDATFTEDLREDGSLSENANTQEGKIEDLINIIGVSRDELEVGEEYTTWMWESDNSLPSLGEWLKIDDWKVQSEEHLNTSPLIATLFTDMGYVRPVTFQDEDQLDVKRVILPKGKAPKDANRVPRGLESISIDQIKSLVNKADQDFFQDIIRNGLKSDLTSRLDARSSDTGLAIKTPKAMIRAMIDPTPENFSTLKRELEDFDNNPLTHMNLDPTRYDDYHEWLSNKVNARGFTRERLMNILDLCGGPSVLDVHLGDGYLKYSKDYNSVKISNSRFTEGESRITVHSDHIDNDFVKLNSCAPRGYSSKFLFAEIYTAKKMGLKYIKCMAAGYPGSGTYSGYAVWPKFGFTTQVNIGILDKSKNTPNAVYAQAVREHIGSRNNFDLLELLSITADIVTLSYDKKEKRKYNQSLLEHKKNKENAIGVKPTFSPTEDTLKVGDKVKAKASVYRSRPELEGVIATVVSLNSNMATVEFNGEKLTTPYEYHYDQYLVKVSPSNVTQDKIDAWTSRSKAWDLENPLPLKPEKSEKVEKKVNVGEKIWGLYGEGSYMKLDLTEGSLSMRVANEYLKKKAFASNVPVEDFLNTPTDLLNMEDPWCWEQEIDKVKVKGELVPWADVVAQYPDAFKSAWYAHAPLREKVEILCNTDKEFESFMKKYKLIDPMTDDKTPSPKNRSLQSMQKGLEIGKEYTYSNPSSRLASEDQDVSQVISDMKLYEESQDPCLQSVWEELRLENYVGRIVSDLLEMEDDPDIIEIQNARKGEQ